MISIMEAVAAWEENKLAYHKAGGSQHDDEEERAQLYKILPENISQDMLSHAHDQPTAAKLIDWMNEKSQFITEHGGKQGQAHLMDTQLPPPPSIPGEGRGRSRRDDYYDEAEEVIES